MKHWVIAVTLVAVVFVSLVAILPVFAQVQLDKEVGCWLYRCWCREQVRIAKLLSEEVGCYLWRCWCQEHAL